MTSLYQLTAEYQRLINQDELDADALVALDTLHTNIEDRIIYKAMAINELKGKLAATNEFIKIAEAKEMRLITNIMRLEQYVLDTMVSNAIEKIDKHPAFDVSVKLNPVAVQAYDQDAIPDEYWVKKEEFSLDKKKIKDDITNLGLVIPGANLTRKVSLRIG
jgi:hypothetical protein